LHHQVGIDPDHIGEVLDLAAVGIVNSAWRNSPVEDWHASGGPLTDGAMSRTNELYFGVEAGSRRTAARTGDRGQQRWRSAVVEAARWWAAPVHKFPRC
jgi:hypothetical protein